MIGGSEMATTFKSSFFAIIVLALSSQLSADETLSIHDAIRIVVVTDDEGIHYEHGCVFYELRKLLAANESRVSIAMDLTDDPLFEVRVLGKSGNSTVYVGDHWMSTSAGIALLPTEAYERITELVEMRKGSGVPKSYIDESIRRASKRIQDPIYVEENRCEK
jgi:hypothetical protein